MQQFILEPLAEFRIEEEGSALGISWVWMLGFLMALNKNPPKCRVWYLHVEII